MSGLINELIAVLTEQAENFENLLALSNEKKDVIIENDYETLQKITSIENNIVGFNQRLEKKRIAVVSDIANVLGQDPKKLTLRALCDLVEGQDEHQALVLVSKRIRVAVDGLKAVNEQNKTLIYNALDLIDFTMNVIRDSIASEPPVYSPTGEQGLSGATFFDAKQ